MQNFALICFAPELSPHCFLNMQVRKKMEEKEEKAPKFTMLQLSNRCWTRNRSIIECSLCCDCLSDLTFCASYLICFLSAKELYAGHKWPTSTLNEYSVLIAERRHPGSRHEICARTRDHWDNSPCPDHGFSVHSLLRCAPPKVWSGSYPGQMVSWGPCISWQCRG